MTYDRFARALAASPPAVPNWLLYRRLDSTNAAARRLAARLAGVGEPPPRLAILAWEQTEGRGRAGRRWASAPGAGVWLTLLEREPAEGLWQVPLLAAVGLCRALEPWLGDRGRIHWPNDLVVGAFPGEGRGGKLGGVLVESFSCAGGDRAVAVGCGVDLEVPEGIEGATGLAAEVDAPPTLAVLAAATTNAVRTELDRLGEPGYLPAAYADRLAHRDGEELRFRSESGEWVGRFAGLDPHGHLRLDGEGGLRTFASGDLVEAR